MGNGMLSQEEIDALLSGSLDDDSPLEEDSTQDSTPEEEIISVLEKDAIGELANISMGTAATTLSQLVGKRVEITTPKVDLATVRQIVDEYPVPYLLVDVRYKRGIKGSNMLVLSREDGSVIVDLMMGGTGTNRTTSLSEIQISGISEAMNQMMGSAATSMSTVFSSVIDITPPTVIQSDNVEDSELFEILSSMDEPLVRIQFRMVIEGVLDSILLQVMPIDFAKEMVQNLLGPMSRSQGGNEGAASQEIQQTEIKAKETTQAAPAAAPAPTAPAAPAIPTAQAPQAPQAAPVAPTAQPQSWEPSPTFVQPAQFAPLTPAPKAQLPNNLELIYDVPLQVSVELGKANKTIKEILDLGPGSVIELDRLAGEPVDMIVNGKLIAKCEVVVINETFGIRITEIVSQNDLLEKLN